MRQKHKYGINEDTGLPRLDIVRVTEPSYKPMDPAKKQQIIDKIETDLRMIAWAQNKLNMLIGEDKLSVEPVWNENKEIV